MPDAQGQAGERERKLAEAAVKNPAPDPAAAEDDGVANASAVAAVAEAAAIGSE